MRPTGYGGYPPPQYGQQPQFPNAYPEYAPYPRPRGYPGYQASAVESDWGYESAGRYYQNAVPPGLYRPMPQSDIYGRPVRPGYAPQYPVRPEYRPRPGMLPTGPPRNEFLESFKQKLTYGKKIDLLELKGHMVELAKDQFGSRHLQQKIHESSVLEKQMIFNEVKDSALPLMSDVFGNYVIQILISEGSPEQRAELISRLKGQVKRLSLDMYGCRCVQKAIEVGTTEQKTALLDEIRPFVAECVDSQNANHVLQKCIETVPSEQIAFLLQYAKDNV